MPLVFHNGNWTIKVMRSVMPGHLSGWLVNESSGQRYVFSVIGDKVRYMRDYKPPTNIPKYLDGYLKNLTEIILNGEQHASLRR